MFLKLGQSLQEEILNKRRDYDFSPLKDADYENLETCDFNIEVMIDSREKVDGLRAISNFAQYDEERISKGKFMNEAYEGYYDNHSDKVLLELKIKYVEWISYLKKCHDNSCKGDYSLGKSQKVLLARIYDYYQETENPNLKVAEDVLGEYISDSSNIWQHDSENLEYRIKFCETMDLLSEEKYLKIKDIRIDVTATPVILEIMGFNKYNNEEIYRKLPAKHFTYAIRLLPKFFEYMKVNTSKEELFYLDIKNGYLFNDAIGGKQLDVESMEFKILKKFVGKDKKILDLAPMLELDRKNKIDKTDLVNEAKEIARKLRVCLSLDKSSVKNKNGYISFVSIKFQGIENKNS